MTDVNEGRGFPLADGEATPTPAPHRQLLFRIIEGALRAEHGVRSNQKEGKPTGYYAGRRAGRIADAALLMEVLYGGDYHEAKKSLSFGVKAAGDTAKDGGYLAALIEPATAEMLARRIAEEALLVI